MDKKFEFKYSAPTQEERKEIEFIQNQYKEKDERMTKLDYLRKLDNKVKNIPICISLILGITGLLIFGLGMTMILEWSLMIWGIIISIIGCVPMGFAYFAYNKLYTKYKNKYSKQILELSSELLNEENTKEL